MTKRIVFIDLMRAYAILMMVQGHLVNALLAPAYRDSEYTLYFMWNFMRGITAPIFFFASGTIFSYLLMKQEDHGMGMKNPRVRKGFMRTLMLLGTGYLLQVSPGMFKFFSTGNFDYLQWFFAVHVLHVIGIAIFMMVCIYLICKKIKFSTGWMFFIIGNLIFLIYPDFKQFDWNSILPIPLSNYFSKQNMSVFTVVPWTGFSLLGGAFGFLLFKRKELYESNLFFIGLIILGLLLSYFSGFLLFWTYRNILPWDNLIYLGNHNFLHFRLGQVLIITGILGVIAKSVRIPGIITTIGSETLSIYVAHSIVIYGTLTTFGLAQAYGKNLGPWECIGLALIVEVIMIVVAYYARDFRNFVKKVFGRKDQ